MNLHENIIDHYGHADLTVRILDGLARAGVDSSRLTPRDLNPIDHLHAGFAPATAFVLKQLDVGAGTRLVDVGCGIGGGSRMAASTGAHVTGIDLTPSFIDTARLLTERTGLSEHVTFLIAAADAVDLPAASFDAAMMIHVGMNIANKGAAFAEVRRLLEPDGAFMVYDQMRVGDGDLTYPMPWAVDASTSFIATPEEYADALRASGFSVERIIDRTEDVTRGNSPDPNPGALSPMVIFGPDFAERIANNIAATAAGRLGAVLLLARAV